MSDKDKKKRDYNDKSPMSPKRQAENIKRWIKRIRKDLERVK